MRHFFPQHEEEYAGPCVFRPPADLFRCGQGLAEFFFFVHCSTVWSGDGIWSYSLGVPLKHSDDSVFSSLSGPCTWISFCTFHIFGELRVRLTLPLVRRCERRYRRRPLPLPKSRSSILNGDSVPFFLQERRWKSRVILPFHIGIVDYEAVSSLSPIVICASAIASLPSPPG